MVIRNFNGVANQFAIDTKNAVYFQSYNSVVAKYDYRTKKVTLGKDWDYSNTTRRHLYQFLKYYTYCNVSSRKEVLKLIEDKTIKLLKDKNTPMK